MDVTKFNKISSSKKINFLNQNFDRIQTKNSLAKQNQSSDLSNLSKYFTQKEKEEYHPDQTDRFLNQTKNKLYSSSQKLSQFKNKKREFQFINQTLNFNIVNKELKSKKRKILSQNFSKLAKLNQNNYLFQSFKNERQKVSDQFQINKKNVLIQKVLSQQQAHRFKQDLIKKVQNLKCQYATNKVMKDKVIKYFVNHQIISKFLEQTTKDTRKLKLRNQNLQLYHKLKDQMVGLLSNQQHFHKHIQSVQNEEYARINSLLQRTPTSQERLVKIQTKSKGNGNLQKPLLQKIQDLLEISKNSIKQAFVNFGQPLKSNEIQIHYNKRLNNNFITQ